MCGADGLFSLYRDASGKDAIANASNLIELCVSHSQNRDKSLIFS
jgi:hypothetical protein